MAKYLVCDVCKGKDGRLNVYDQKINVIANMSLEVLVAKEGFMSEGVGSYLKQIDLDICDECIGQISYTGKYLLYSEGLSTGSPYIRFQK